MKGKSGSRAGEGTDGRSIRRYRLQTAFGPMLCGWTDGGLAELSFARVRRTASSPSAGQAGGQRRGPDRASKLKTLARREGKRAVVFLRELDEYFRTGRARFRTPLDLSAGSEFGRAVWRALRRIPSGRVRAYGEIAREIGRPGAARAVGNACGRNPVVILVPCHRVVASNGLGGFGAGLERKRGLLDLEGVSV